MTAKHKETKRPIAPQTDQTPPIARVKAYEIPTGQERFLEIESAEPIIGHGKEPKQRLICRDPQRHPWHSLKYIERLYDGDATHDIFTDGDQERTRYRDTWLQFIEAEIPVVPELLETDRQSLLLPDLTEDGSQLYGKDAVGRIPLDPTYQLNYIDEAFLDIMINPRDVQDVADTYVAQANEYGLGLPIDDGFEMVVHPNGRWDLVTLDLRQASQISDATPASRVEQIQALNQQTADQFVNQLKLISNDIYRGRPRLFLTNYLKGLLR